MKRLAGEHVGMMILSCALILAAACGDDGDNNPGPGDTRPPMAVTNLAVVAMTDSSVTLTWTAPGDDCQDGTAAQYDIRYSLVPDSVTAWWDSATAAADSLDSPKAPWEPETLTVEPLAPDTVYYFALKTADEVPNWSGISNVAVAGVTDSVPPAAVVDLSAEPVSEHSVLLVWSAPGDDDSLGTAMEYDVRYGEGPITVANWDSSAIVKHVTGEPAPSPAGGRDSVYVSGLSYGTEYYFAIKTLDEKGNESNVSNDASATTYGLSDDQRSTRAKLVTMYLPEACSNEDSASYDAALDEEYTFELLPLDSDPSQPSPWWEKPEELRIAGNMFESRYNDDGQRVVRIALDIVERSDAVDNTNYPGKPPGETWFRVTALIDLLVVVEDPADPYGVINYVVSSDQIFVVRPDPDDASLWVVYKQRDQEPINKRLLQAAFGSSTEQTSWGSVKELFR